VCCSALQCVAVCCSVLQCFAVCCSVLQCVAVCCSVLQCVYMHTRGIGSVLVYVYIGIYVCLHTFYTHVCLYTLTSFLQAKPFRKRALGLAGLIPKKEIKILGINFLRASDCSKNMFRRKYTRIYVYSHIYMNTHIYVYI